MTPLIDALDGVADGRVLVIDDNPANTALAHRILTRAGLHDVRELQDPLQAADVLQEFDPDLVLLDLRMPGMDGMQVLRSIKEHWPESEVVVITGYPCIETAKEAMKLGAYDYLAKPFDLDELVARMRALVRRHAGRAQTQMRLGELSLDPHRREVRLAGTPVDLAHREFALLEALLEIPGAVLSTEQLEEKLYGWGEEVASNAVEVHVHRLRKKLGAAWIRNVRGVGYRLVEPA